MSMVSREPLSSRCRLVTRKALEWRASAASAFSATYRRTCSLGLRQPRAHYGVCACLRSAASLHGLIVLSPALRRTPGCTVTVAGPGSRCRLRRAAPEALLTRWGRGPARAQCRLAPTVSVRACLRARFPSHRWSGRGPGTLAVGLRPLCRSAPAFGPLPLGPLSDDRAEGATRASVPPGQCDQHR